LAILREYPVSAVRIRHHGDFHLGQVLFTGNDFMIIDFEGEPARPLAERRMKTLAMRDVAGMIRSFQYAAYAALFGRVPGLSVDSNSAEAIESWADYWTAIVSAEYLTGYRSAASGAAFMPSGVEEQRMILDAFLLQKALYEVSYELNNRPTWVGIPLRGILQLLS
jgi:maltose alpha-D-glucosyltransferase/alpha-amylase